MDWAGFRVKNRNTIARTYTQKKNGGITLEKCKLYTNVNYERRRET